MRALFKSYALPFELAAGGSIASGLFAILLILALRARARQRRRYVRLRLIPYRGEDCTAEGIVSMFEALHRRLVRRWWRRLFGGQPSVGLEVHCDRAAWLSITCPEGCEARVLAALRIAYPNVRLEDSAPTPGLPPCLLRLKKQASFTKRAKRVDRFEHERLAGVNRLLTTMAACGAPAYVQFALTPVPACFEGHAKRAYKRHENRLSRERKLKLPPLDPSRVEVAELMGGLQVQHRPLFFADVRVVAASRGICEQIASELRAARAENHLVERGTAVRHGWFGLYTRRVLRGEGNTMPSLRKSVFASTELASLWHVPSLDYSTVPFARSPLPLAPAPPAILRTSRAGDGSLRDAHGMVSIHPQLRRLNTAVQGASGQGKSSYLVASVAEDLRREECAVIVIDPKGEIAEAVVSLVPDQRRCTLLDLGNPTCGFHPPTVDAAASELERLLDSPLVKGVLLSGSPRVSFDELIANGDVLVVKGAVGKIGAVNTSVLMQLLLAMLGAALARRQDSGASARGRAVALKVDDAPLVLNRSFADTMALSRSAGLETVACWQTGAQWSDRDLRRRLDVLFAHRVYFATSSVEDARGAAKLTMAEFSDIVRPNTRSLSALGHPDVRLHMPRHSAVVSWVTPQGRQAPFVAHTLPTRVDERRVAHHVARQAERGRLVDGSPNTVYADKAADCDL
ncbi:MAG TPA: hypothetical protein VIG42_10020 [Solirubrobacteraceae bacterium]